MSLVKDAKAKHITQMLHLSLKKEKLQWKKCQYSRNYDDTSVNGRQRDVVIKWLQGLNEFLRFSPEAIFTAAGIIDQFLRVIKAHPKYLYCIAITSFYVAVKITEEYEVIPTVKEFLDASGSSCSVSELVRMERTILKKLDWCLKHVTSFDFLHMFYGLMLVNCAGLPGVAQFGPANLLCLGLKLKSILPCYELSIFSPSTVALSLISLELESACKKWLPLTIYLCSFSEVNYSDFMLCRKEVAHSLSHMLEPMNALYPFMKPSMLFIPVKNMKEDIDVEEIYDSIKHLYIEETIRSCSVSAYDNGTHTNDTKFTTAAI